MEIKIETPESFTRKKSNVNHNQLLLDISKEQEINIEESENDDNQKRFKFSRKKKESKINNVLYIDSTITSADTAKEKFNYVKWRENGNLTLMNKQLEAQKKIELDRYIYEKLKTIINKNEESLWKACPDDFDEEKTFEDRLKDNNKENLVKSCFLEIIEMDETEKLIVNLESLNPESLRYRWGRIFLHLRKYILCYFFFNSKKLLVFSIIFFLFH